MPRVASWLCAATTAAALATVASCFVAGFEVTTGVVAAGGVGGGVAGSAGALVGAGGIGASGAMGGDGCVPVHPPGPPANPDPGADVEDLVVAVRSIDFAEQDVETTGPTVGYDLDDVCTCRGDGPSCVEPDYATGDHCDGPRGRDSAFSTLMVAARTLNSELSSASLSGDMAAGQFGLLVRVWNYNGQANDGQVTVAAYPSGGFDENDCAPGGVPAWNGEDAWPVDATAIAGTGGSGTGGVGGAGTGGCAAGQLPAANPDDARFVDSNAYVADSVLVASMSQLVLLLTGEPGPGRFRLSGVQLTGRLERAAAAGPWSLRDGVLAGRVAMDDVWLALSALVNGGSPMCTDNALFSLLQNGVCRHPDIASELSGPTAPCDAISFGMAFEADAARLGVVYRPASGSTTCSPQTEAGPLECGD